MSNFQKRKRLTRLKIITAAMETFHEKGYAQATLNSVARQLSVTDKALYYYFDSKDELYLECQNTCSERVAAVIAAIDKQEETGLAKVKTYAIAMIRQSGDLHPYDKRLPHHLENTKQGIRFRASERSNDEAVIGWIREGITDGSILPENPKMLWKWNEGALLWLRLWSPEDAMFETRDLEDHTLTMLDRSLSHANGAAQSAPPA